MLLACLWLVAALAGPGDAPPPGIAAGEDIGAWQDLLASQPEGPAEIAALEAFLVAWPESALAEVAWTRLRELGALDEVAARHPELHAWLPYLERSRAEHEEELARRPAATVVVPLDADGIPLTTPTPHWSAAFSLGGGISGRGAWGGAGFRVDRGMFGVVARAGYSDVGWGQAGVRVYVPSPVALGRDPRPLVGFAELTAATDARFALCVGGRLVLTRRLWVEVTAGASIRGVVVGPALALEFLVSP